jgi:hypothetical protein
VVYGGTTDPYAYYSIYPANPLANTVASVNPNTERRTVYYSEPGQPEAFPTINQVTFAEDAGAGEFTGLMSMGPYLFVWAQNRVYQLSYTQNPSTDGQEVTAAQRGCVNNKCWITTEDVAWSLDTRGIHIFSGTGDSPIGSSEVQDLFRPHASGPYKISWNVSRNFHSVFDPGEGVARWFVTIGGSYAPHHAIAYQVRLRRWWLEEYPFPIGASCLGRLNGKPQVFLGSDAGRVFALNSSPCDGLDPSAGTIRGTAASSGIDWLDDGAAIFPTANLVNNYVTISQGAGKGQRRKIVSVSGTRLNVNYPWTTRLNTSSVYQIGGVSWKWKSGWFKFTPDPNLSHRAAHITFGATEDQAGMYLRTFQDFATDPLTWANPGTLEAGNGMALLANDPTTDVSIDTTKPKGYVWQRMDNFREEYTDAPSYLAVEIGGVTNSEAFLVKSVRLDGV